ncbi:UNVERIFIED_CONTAM: hypothetical protein FKN15_063284 [Acipenser sinensis]
MGPIDPRKGDVAAKERENDISRQKDGEHLMPLMEMLLDLAGLNCIRAHLMLSASLPSNRLVQATIAVMVVMSSMYAIYAQCKCDIQWDKSMDWKCTRGNMNEEELLDSSSKHRLTDLSENKPQKEPFSMIANIIQDKGGSKTKLGTIFGGKSPGGSPEVLSGLLAALCLKALYQTRFPQLSCCLRGAVWSLGCSVFEGSLPNKVSTVVMLFKVFSEEVVGTRSMMLCWDNITGLVQG